MTNLLQNIGNTGVGTTVFNGSLTADSFISNGSVTGTTMTATTTSAGTLSATSINDTGSLTVGGSSSLQGVTATSIASSGELAVKTNVLKVDTVNNRVGVNVTTPTEALDVTGNIKASGTMTVNSDLTVDTTTLKVLASSNRVGVNTITPTEALDVVGNMKASGTLTVAGASSLQGVTAASVTSSGDLTVKTNVLKVNTTSNMVGIGTATPSVPLDVVGNAKITGALEVTGSTTVGSLSTAGVIQSLATTTNGLFRGATYIGSASTQSITSTAAAYRWGGTKKSDFGLPIGQTDGVFTNNTGGALYILVFFNVYFAASNSGTWRAAWVSKSNDTTKYGWCQSPAGGGCTNAGTTCAGMAYFKLLNTETFQVNVQSDVTVVSGTTDSNMLTVFTL